MDDAMSGDLQTIIYQKLAALSTQARPPPAPPHDHVHRSAPLVQSRAEIIHRINAQAIIKVK